MTTEHHCTVCALAGRQTKIDNVKIEMTNKTDIVRDAVGAIVRIEHLGLSGSMNYDCPEHGHVWVVMETFE